MTLDHPGFYDHAFDDEMFNDTLIAIKVPMIKKIIELMAKHEEDCEYAAMLQELNSLLGG